MFWSYWIFALKCKGKSELVCTPHLLHVQLNDWCSMILGLMGGITISCFLSYNLNMLSLLNSSPHCLQYPGTCFYISSGSSPIFNGLPLCPGCPRFFCLTFSENWIYCFCHNPVNSAWNLCHSCARSWVVLFQFVILLFLNAKFLLQTALPIIAFVIEHSLAWDYHTLSSIWLLSLRWFKETLFLYSS